MIGVHTPGITLGWLDRMVIARHHISNALVFSALDRFMFPIEEQQVNIPSV